MIGREAVFEALQAAFERLFTERQLKVLPIPTRRKPQLTSLDGVHVEMARVYREMESGKRDTQDGSRLVYVLGQLAHLLELTKIERRLILLEGGRLGGCRHRRGAEERGDHQMRIPSIETRLARLEAVESKQAERNWGVLHFDPGTGTPDDALARVPPGSYLVVPKPYATSEEWCRACESLSADKTQNNS